MAQPKVAIGLAIPPKPPVGSIKQVVWAARLLRFDCLMVWDHLQDIFPEALWERTFTWVAGQNTGPHEFYEWQTTLGWLAARAGRMRIGVAVTEATRRHPAVIAQAMLTLAHLTKRPPILGIGSGEAENIVPYGLDFTQPVGRLEEGLGLIRHYLDSTAPLTVAGEHVRSDGGMVGLDAPKGKKPEIWVGALGPRMLGLTGRYGDGWYPIGLLTPVEYESKLATVRAAARAAGRDPAAIVPSLQPYIVVAPTEKEARAMLDTPTIRFFGLLAPAESWRKLGLAHPFGEGFRGNTDWLPERIGRAELKAAIGRVPLEMAEAGLIWGTPATIAARLGEFREAGMRHVVPQAMSAALTRRDALYSLRALRAIGRALA